MASTRKMICRNQALYLYPHLQLTTLTTTFRSQNSPKDWRPQEKHTFTDLVTADTDLIVTEEMTDDDIVTELLDKNNNCFFFLGNELCITMIIIIWICIINIQ